VKSLSRLFGWSCDHSVRSASARRRKLNIDSLEDRRMLAVMANFDNGAYVDTSNTTNAESDNMLVSLAGMGHSVNPFSGITAGDFAAALSGKSVLVIPELEVGDLNADLSPAARTTIANFVNAGGTIIVAGTTSNRDTDLINAIFGFSLAGGGSSGASTRNNAAAAGTQFADSPPTLADNNLTDSVQTSSLPAGTRAIYTRGGDTTVAMMPFGSGQVIYLGWDWYDAVPAGGQDGGWNLVLTSSAAEPFVFNAVGGSDLTLRRNGVFFQIVDNATNTVLAQTSVFTTARIVINGSANLDDTLLVDHAFGGVIDRPISFNGGVGGADLLRLRGGNFNTVIHTSTGPNSGTISYDGLMVNFSGLEPVNDSTVALNYIFNATNSAEVINVVNGPTLFGQASTQINSGSATFELVNFQNKTNVTINALDGLDIVNLNNTTAAFALQNLKVDTGATDGDIVNVHATPSGVTTTVTSSAGRDFVNVGNFGNVQGILGAVFVSNPTNLTDLNIDDSTDSTGRNVTVSNAFVTGIAPAGINFVANDIGNLSISGGTGGNIFNVNNTQAAAGSNINTINGGSGADTFNIIGSGLAGTNNFFGQGGIDFFNLTAAPAATLNLDGGATLFDTLFVTGGPFTNVVYSAGTVDSGNITYDGALVSFTTLESVFDTSSATNFTFHGTNLADQIFLVNGQPASGDTIQITSGGTTFGLVNVNNKTNIIVNGQNRPDTFTLTANLNAVGLSNLTLNGEDSTNTGDDNAADTFNIHNTLTGVTTTINGGGGDDVTNLTPTSQFLDNLLGPIVVNGQTDNDALVVNDQSNNFNDNYTLTSTTVSRPLAGLITYGTVEALTVNGGAGTSVWTISSTMAGANNSTTVNAGNGNDVFNIAGNTLGAGSTNSFNGQGNDDTFNVSPPPSGATLNVDGGAQGSIDLLNVSGGVFTNVIHNANSAAGGNISYDGAPINFAGLELINDLNTATNHTFNAPSTGDTINVVDGPILLATQTFQINSGAGATFTTVNVGKRTNLTVNGQNGADTITYNLNVTITGLTLIGLHGEDASNTGDDNAADIINVVTVLAGMTVSATGGGGNDVFNVTGTGLASGSATSLSGQAGDDTFNVSPPPTSGASLSVDGGLQGSADTLNVTGGSFTNVVHNATSATGGDISYDGSLVSFTGLELINDQSTATNYAFNAPATSDTINVVNGPVVLGNQTFQINSGAGATFATVNAANRSNLTLNGQNGADNITFNLTAAVVGLTTVALNGEDASNTGDDNAIDTITVVATRPNMTLTATGGGGNDIFNVTGTGLGANSNNTFSGQDGDDTFNVSPPAGNATLSVDGGPHVSGDTLIVTGGPFTNMTFNPTSATSGNLSFDGAAVNYTNVESLNDLTNTANFTFNGTNAAETINIVDGPVVLGIPTTQINSGVSNAFPTFNFANRTNLVINGQNGADTITLNLVNSGASLATIGLHGEDATNTGDDNAADIINVVSTRPNVVLTATGGGGGDTFNITGSGLGAGSTNSFSGQNGDDSFNLSPPSSTATVNLDGGAHATADTLTATGGNFTNIVHNATSASGGNITYDGAALNFTALEVINDLSVAANYTFNAPATSDTINVVDGPVVLANQTIQINSGAGATFTAVNVANRGNLTINGQNGADTMTLNLVAAGAGVISIGLHGEDTANTGDDNAADTISIVATRPNMTVNSTGGGGNDTFNVTGSGLGAGSTTNLSGQDGDDRFNVAPPASGATLSVDGGAQSTSDILTVSGGSFTNVTHNANSATSGNSTFDGTALNFNGLELINDLSSATNYTFNAPNTGDTINIVDGPVVLANQTFQINSGNATTFTTVNVANRTTLTVNGQNGADTITFNLGVAGAALTTIALNGEDSSNTGDDNAADTITIESTRLGTATSVTGGGGNDIVNVTPTSQSLDSIQGSISLNGNTGNDTLNLYDQSTGGNITYTINDTSVSRPGKTITFTSFEVVATYAGTGLNEFDVTPSSTTEFFVDGNLPAPGTLPGDFLKINFAGTTGRKLTISSPGAGQWDFSNRKSVKFNSIEEFNYFAVMAVGADAGKTSKPVVQLVDAETKEFGQKILTGNMTYRDGVRVAMGDLNGDGIPELVTVPGRNGGGMVKVFDILTGAELTQYRIQAHPTNFVNGLNVAVGDVDGDGWNDIITVPGRGVSDVKVFRNQISTNAADPFTDTSYRAFMAWTKKFIGGSSVAAADLTGDGKAEIILGSGSGMRATINVYNVSTAATTYSPIRTILPFANKFKGGVSVSVGRLNADGTPDIIAGAGPSGNSQVMTFNGATGAQLSSFFAYTDKSKSSPVRAIGVDFDDDGIIDRLVTAQGPDGKTKELRRFQPNGVLVDAIMATDTDFVGYFLA